MPNHPAIAPGRVAVITGGASGIGLAAARRFARLGLKVAIADLEQSALDAAVAGIRAESPGADVLTVRADVSRFDDLVRLRERVHAAYDAVSVLMNNAGTGARGGPFDHYDAWQKVLGTNLWGVINGVQVFTQAMIDQKAPAIIVNTGSKQGITCPPGNTAYNVSKAGVKVLTEGLQHSLRNIEGCQVTAHLLVPGWTFTGITSKQGDEKPAGAWTADQVIDFMLDRLEAGDFYIICPDNDVTRDIDNARILWGAGDIVENRPPLSRWHPDFAEDFAAFVQSG